MRSRVEILVLELAVPSPTHFPMFSVIWSSEYLSLIFVCLFHGLLFLFQQEFLQSLSFAIEEQREFNYLVRRVTFGISAISFTLENKLFYLKGILVN